MSKQLEAEQEFVLTKDAEAALSRTGLSRRSFLGGAGALIVSFSMSGALKKLAAQAAPVPSPLPERAQRIGDGESPGSPPWAALDSWIAIAADGGVIAYSGKTELGQGMATVQTQLVAEELCVPINRVKLIYCDTAITPDQGITTGSQSTFTNFNHKNLAQAAATAREALVDLASKQLGIPADQLAAKDGAVSVKSKPSKKVGYGQLLNGKKFDLKVNPDAKRKPASEWTILGKPVPRLDFPAIVTGQLDYVQYVRLPGMLHGKVVRPAAFGAKFVSYDPDSVKDVPGLVKVVVKNDFVGVVAEKTWQAIQAVNKIKVTWSGGGGLPDHATFYDYLRTHKPSRDQLFVNSKDVDEKLGQAATVIKATYYYPNQAHGSMGTSCAVADITDNSATVYAATQGVWPLRGTTAMLLGRKPEDVHVIFKRGSGCYGQNGADTVAFDAVLMSQAVGRPVHVQLSRKDEFAWENYGFAFVIDERAGLDADGNIAVWDHESWSAVMGGRPSYGTPGNLITGTLAGFPVAPFQPRSPAPEPDAYSNLANDVPSYFSGAVKGTAYGSGIIKSERSLTHIVRSPLFTAPLRSPGRLQNTFAAESFIDEVAAHGKVDPVEYRLRHLSDERLIAVVKGASELAKWEKRPSPNPKNTGLSVMPGRGISCVAYEGENGWAALVAEIEVHRDTGKIVVKHMYISCDAGPISNPDGLRNQMEGGTIHGLSRALGEEVIWDDKNVTSVNWASYHALFLGFGAPEITVKPINRPDKSATGAGETAITNVAAAIANAIFDATGARIRQVPFTPERVKAALAALA